MEIREQKLSEVVVGYICEICSAPCAKTNGDFDTTEMAILSAQWGYWSKDKDLTWHECHMCEGCFEKVKRFIERDLQGTVRTGSTDQPARPVFGSCQGMLTMVSEDDEHLKGFEAT